MSEIAIRIDDLGKRYRLSLRRGGHDTLRDAIASAGEAALQRLRTAGQRTPPARRHEEFWALRHVSLDILEGEVVGVVGRNGAGKSTLLKILSRVTEPTEGSADLRGRLGSLLEVGTGFHPELTGRDNTYLNGAILGMRKSEVRRKFDAIVDFAEIEQFIDMPVKRYSSGMYVRLAFAVAAHLEPEILLVDEVLAVGDIAFQRKCLGRIQEVGREGRTVVFVSHTMAAVEQLCDRAIYLDRGMVKADGATTDVVAAYLAESLPSAGSDVDLSEHPARLSKSGAFIAQLTLKDATGSPSARYEPDSPLTIEFVVDPPAPLREPRLAASIEDAFGRRITTVASYFQGDGLEPISDRSRVECTIPRLGLGAGRYLISVSLHDRYLGTLDNLQNVSAFDVEWRNSFDNGEPYYPFYGPVLTSSSWLRLAGDGGSPESQGEDHE
ncbi:MAG: ABC transporter ATP-binding protein [Actinobacteria bacterium]|nr:ABC transporter ATP-binding protein [Actinomycetota bacterium]